MRHFIDVFEQFFFEGDNGVLACINKYLSLITSNDVLILLCIALPLVGLGIGLIRRLVRIRA